MPNQTIDYHLQTFLNEAGNIGKLPIPIKLIGYLKSPQIKLDIDALTKGIAKQQMQNVKSQIQERIEKGKIPEKAGKFLQNLLGP